MAGSIESATKTATLLGFDRVCVAGGAHDAVFAAQGPARRSFWGERRSLLAARRRRLLGVGSNL
jgi:hypothetical protein